MTYIDMQINSKHIGIFMICSTKQEYNMFYFFQVVFRLSRIHTFYKWSQHISE